MSCGRRDLSDGRDQPGAAGRGQAAVPGRGGRRRARSSRPAGSELHIFATVSPDRARQEAKRLEAEIAAGREVGPLAGVPTGVKDLIYTKGIRTASGSNAYADFVPDEDDVVVERITAAGAIVIGKTQVPEFGYSGTGQTPLAEPTGNPWNPARTPAGPPRAPARRWPPGSGRSRWAATAAARSASRPASAGSTASSRRWAGSRSTRARRTTATPACPAGSRWSTSARSPAPSPTRP